MSVYHRVTEKRRIMVEYKARQHELGEELASVLSRLVVVISTHAVWT